MSLDDILNATGVQIVSEENDFNKINARAALWDEAETGKMVRAAFRQQYNREPNEVEYAAEIEKILKEREPEARKAAIDRANLGTRQGKIMFAGTNREPIWHGLGTIVSQAMNGKEVIKLSHTDYLVDKVRHTYVFDGKTYDSDSWSIIRTDTGDELGVVGSRYTAFQNHEAIEFIDSVLELFGAKYETAGALGKGETVWYLADCPKNAYEVKGTEVKNYLLLSNSHDGTSAIQVVPTDMYVVCANTRRIALAQTRRGIAKGFSIRHTKNAKHKVELCQKTLGIVSRAQEKAKEDALLLAKTQVSSVQQLKYFDNVLDTICQVTAQDMQTSAAVVANRYLDAVVSSTEREAMEKKIQKQMNKRKSLLEEILEANEDPRYNQVVGTAWGMYNAVSDVADHSLSLNRYHGNTREKRESRFLSGLQGKNDDFKQIAFVEALKLAN